MPTMWTGFPGKCFLNPYDISQLRDFNIFAMIVTLLGSILNRASLIGNDTSGAGRTPHEQKMANVLGTWRNGFTYTAMMLLAIITVTFMGQSTVWQGQINSESPVPGSDTNCQRKFWNR